MHKQLTTSRILVGGNDCCFVNVFAMLAFLSPLADTAVEAGVKGAFEAAKRTLDPGRPAAYAQGRKGGVVERTGEAQPRSFCNAPAYLAPSSRARAHMRYVTVCASAWTFMTI